MWDVLKTKQTIKDTQNTLTDWIESKVCLIKMITSCSIRNRRKHQLIVCLERWDDVKHPTWLIVVQAVFWWKTMPDYTVAHRRQDDDAPVIRFIGIVIIIKSFRYNHVFIYVFFCATIWIDILTGSNCTHAHNEFNCCPIYFRHRYV